MTEKIILPNWRELAFYSDKGMQPNVLVETHNYKSVIAGMAAGNLMPPHSEGPAIFHFLEGSGKMIVDEKTFDVQAGATVIVPNDANRGIEAKTQLAFLAVRLPEKTKHLGVKRMKQKRWMPYVMIGAMILVMFGVMALFNLILGEFNPLVKMFSGNGDLGTKMWSVMLVPLLGLLLMFSLMFFFFRWMTRGKGFMSMRVGNQLAIHKQGEHRNVNTLTFQVPAVNCAHCKIKIEQEVGKLPGVALVNVDVDARQMTLNLISPPTRTEIETLLTEMGYPPENQ